MKKHELEEKLDDLISKFDQDPEVLSLTAKLKERFDALYQETFTSEDLETEEIEEVYEEFYASLRESDPDEVTIFDVMWFK